MQNVHGVHEKSTEVQYLSDPELKKCKMKNVFEKNGKKKAEHQAFVPSIQLWVFVCFFGWLVGCGKPEGPPFYWLGGLFWVLGVFCVWVFVFVFVFWVGGWRNRPKPNAARFAHFGTNHRNKGLISVDRRTSLLSHVQYPVPYQSRLQRIYRSQCPKGD